MRILIWVIIFLAVVVWLKRTLAGLARSAEPDGAEPTRRGRERHSETMVQCAHCGVHFPASEAVAGIGGAVYCSTEHLKLARE
jgi:uncharacterized protein